MCSSIRPKTLVNGVLFVIVPLLLFGCVYAQVALSNGAAISNGAALIPSPQPLCVITTSSLPGATVGVFYSVTLQTANCPGPLTWSIISGALPSWAALNSSTGAISGTPSAAGSASFTVQVLDANSHTATFNAAFNITASSGSGSPALPDPLLLSWCTTVACTPSPNTVLTVGDGTTGICAPSGCNFTTGQISSALQSVSCGQTLEIQNTVYVLPNSNIRLQNGAACDQAHWITIERDISDATFPAEGTQVDPCYAGIPQTVLWFLPYPTADTTPNTCARHMPLFLKGGSSTKFLFDTGVLTQPGSSSYRFIGIQFGRLNTWDLDNGWFSFNNNAECTAADVACMNHQPSYIGLDRVIIQGDAQRQDTRGILFGGCRWCFLVDSYVYDYKLSYAGGGGDSQAFAMGGVQNLTNAGWYKIHNNFLNGASEGQIACGNFTEPLSPSTGADGNVHDVWEAWDFFRKNPLMDTQIGQTQSAAVTIDGQSYGPAPDQEFTQAPSAIQLAVNQTYRVTTWTANDSNAGTNRSPAGTNTLTCGGGTCGTVATVFDGDTNTGIHKSVNAFVSTYTAPAAVPPAAVTYTRCFVTPDGRAATLGNNRSLCASTVFTIVAASPVHKMVVGPSAPDLKIQPSYSDAYGNVRQFCLQFYAIPNFTSSINTWDVDGIAGGNSSVGTVDSIGLYCSSPTTGVHTIHATASDSTIGSSIITVSNSAPIVAFDGRAFTAKNMWEAKCGKNILLENSLLEVVWGSAGNGGGQKGNSFLVQIVNQNSQTTDGSGRSVGYGPELGQDITLRNLVFRYAGEGFTIAGHASSPGTLGLHRLSVSNFLIDDASEIRWGHGFSSIFPTGSLQGDGNPSTTDTLWTSATNTEADNIFITHGTIVGHSTSAFGITNNLAQHTPINWVIQNNLWMAPGSKTFVNPTGDAGDCDTASGTGSGNNETVGFSLCAVPHTLDHIALLDSTASTSNFLNPTLIWPIASTSVGFVNYNGGVGGDYRLCTGFHTPSVLCGAASIFAAGQANQASDSTALGANAAALQTVESNVRSGVRTP